MITNKSHSGKDQKTPHEKKALAVGHIPSGLFLVCAQNDTTKSIDGYLASWVQQISFEPLMIAIAIKPGRPAYDLIMNDQVFTLNIIGDHDSSYIKHFWDGYDRNKNPFRHLEIRHGDFGGIILKAAKSAIECKRHSSIKPGDHELVIADVLSSCIQTEDANPLVHIRKTGADY